MLPLNREYHFIGELTLRKSRKLKINAQPKDDEVNWLFLNFNGKQFSFVYKIEKPLEATFQKPFTILMAFTFVEKVKKIIKKDTVYEVLRGIEEPIGTVKITSILIETNYK